jgi:hypothetical protein
MSNFKETKTPYEFLVRFNENGDVQGAHVVYLERVYKDKEVINQKTSDPLPISLGIEMGFPLSDILDELQTSYITTNEKLFSENFELKKQLEEMQSDKIGGGTKNPK